MENKEKKTKAISMRKDGKSYGEIGRTLGVAKSTLSFWLKDIPLSKAQRSLFYTERIRNLTEGPHGSRARRQREVEIITSKARAEISKELSFETQKLLGAGLYWAEGSKRGLMQITNSDPALMYFMVQWFAETFKVSPRTFKARLNIYSQQNETDLKGFWSNLCGIPLERFGKSYVKPSSKNVKKNNLYYGTIQVTVPKSSDMKCQIFGWLEGAILSQSKTVGKYIRQWGHLQDIERPINLRYTPNTRP